MTSLSPEPINNQPAGRARREELRGEKLRKWYQK
jgi:hypothetical protein